MQLLHEATQCEDNEVSDNWSSYIFINVCIRMTKYISVTCILCLSNRLYKPLNDHYNYYSEGDCHSLYPGAVVQCSCYWHLMSFIISTLWLMLSFIEHTEICGTQATISY